MRAVRISLIVVLVMGLWITMRSSSYSREENVTRLADLEATIQEQGSVLGWAQAIAVGGSLVLVLVGLRKR
jgi:hypothetical protein